MLDHRVKALLDFWFGDMTTVDLPNTNRTTLWFGENEVVKQKILAQFSAEFESATMGQLDEWAKTPRGRLALIIVLDQFPRYIHRATDKAFAYDELAQHLCLDGIEKKMDHSLTLIERVFFYMPLVHSEDDNNQEASIRLYQSLVNLSLIETIEIYQLFLAYAYAHFKVIKEFGRFPQRNKYLKRRNTDAETVFLSKT